MASIVHTRTTSTNDSDAIILTCPDDKIIEVFTVHLDYASTATVGNRQVRLGIYDADNALVMDFHAGAVQAASNTYHYVFSRGVYRETSFTDGQIQSPIPFGTVLLSGWTLRIYDSAAIDAAADDMIVNTVYRAVENVKADYIT